MSTKNLFLALLSGILLGLSFPPFHLGFLAWIFLVPLFKIFYEKNKFQEKALSFYIAGFTSYAIITHWVALNSGTSVQLFCLILQYVFFIHYTGWFFCLFLIL